MQIGSCWFDIAEGELVNHNNETSWKMPKVEFEVLKLFVEHRGQVLSKQQLLQCIDQEKNAQSRLEDAIYRIRLFVGREHAELFESIDTQGYVLHHKMKRTSRSFMELPGNDISYKNTLLSISLVLLLFVLLYAFFEPTKKLLFFNEQNLATQSGNLGYYLISEPNDKVSPNTNPNVAHFLTELQHCEHMDWQKMFYSLSTDKRVLNIALKRYDQQGLAIKNIKVIAPENDFKFIDQSWLKSMEICSK